MSLAVRSSQEFQPNTRFKGLQYYQQGDVTLVETRARFVLANVTGSRRQPYQVTLDWEDINRAVLVRCSCPHFESGTFCKHIWATVLAADEAGVTASIPGTGNITLIGDSGIALDGVFTEDRFDDDDEYENDEYFDDGDDWRSSPIVTFDPVFSSRRITSTVARAGRERRTDARRNGRSGDWKKLLPTVDPLEQPASLHPWWRYTERRSRRIHYLVDLESSVTAGTLVIRLFEQEIRKDGTWRKIKPLRPHLRREFEYSDDDQYLLRSLPGNMVSDDTYGWHRGSLPQGLTFTKVELVPEHFEWTLPQLSATGRFGWFNGYGHGPELAQPLRWDAGPPWNFRLVVSDQPRKKKWCVTGELTRGGKSITLDGALALLPTGLVVTPDSVARFEMPLDPRWIQLLSQSGQFEVSHADKENFIAELWRSGQAPEIHGTAELQLSKRTGSPRGCLKVLQPKPRYGGMGEAPTSNLFADVELDYDGTVISADDDRQAWPAAGASEILVRDPDREAELLEELLKLNFRPNDCRYQHPDATLRFKSRDLDDIVQHLTASGWVVEAEGIRIHTPGAIRLSIQSGIDWFDLEGSVEFGDTHASLPALLAAVRQGDTFVRLDDGSRGILPTEWLAKFAPLAQLARDDDQRLRFKPGQGLLLDALLSAQAPDVKVEMDRKFQHFRQRLQSFSGLTPANPPRSFHGTLRPYQRDGLSWLQFLNNFQLGGCLADDMGLGKTVQVLALLAARRSRRVKKGEIRRSSLVVVPKSLVFNWQEEAARFAPRLNVVVYVGLDRKSLADRFDDCDLVVTTYGTLRRDIGELKERRFDYAILDESQAVKNANSQTAKACRLIQADHRLAMTGTPVENHLGELWSLFEFLNPGILGRSTAFNRLARQTTSSASNGVAEPTLELLRQGLAPFILRRTKEQVLDDLPEKTEQTIHCQLDRPQRRKYNELRDYYRQALAAKIAKQGLKRSKIQVLEALLRLRQAACHVGLLDKKLRDQSSAKLDSLLENLREIVAEGHKALVFSQFTSFLSIVRARLDADQIVYEYLDGRTRKRKDRVTRFQTDDQCPLFLISLKAGGHGLNLTAADYVFLLDPWWNPAVEAQAIDRAHRIGQTRPVFAYRLIATDTVEEKILQLQANKRELADAIVSADANLMRALTADDLQLLLS